MSHLILYNSDSLEPPHPLSPLPQGERGASVIIQSPHTPRPLSPRERGDSILIQSPLPLSGEGDPALRGGVRGVHDQRSSSVDCKELSVT